MRFLAGPDGVWIPKDELEILVTLAKRQLDFQSLFASTPAEKKMDKKIGDLIKDWQRVLTG